VLRYGTTSRKIRRAASDKQPRQHPLCGRSAVWWDNRRGSFPRPFTIYARNVEDVSLGRPKVTLSLQVLDCTTMELPDRLEELKSELRAFICRPRTLAGDLVLFGLGADVMETATSVLHTAASALPHKAYSNARLAFEGAQILVVLATHERYELTGSQAWVYFEMKSAAWRASAQRQRNAQPATNDQQILQRRVEQMATIWDSVCQGHGKSLRDAFDLVWRERKKRPDNCLHENMTARQHTAYELFAASDARAITGDSAAVNQAMYEILCHETHAHPRLESFGIIRDSASETIKVDRLPRNLQAARNAVMGGTELAVWEAALGLRWQRTGAV
jgi:hypothetical protein